MTLSNEFRTFSISHLSPVATAAFGDDGPEIEITIDDIREPALNPVWSLAMQRAVEAENVRLAAAGKAPIDGTAVGYDWVPDWEAWAGIPADAYAFGTWVRHNDIIWQIRIGANVYEPPMFWKAVSEDILPWVQPVGGGDHYKLGDKALHAGAEWLSRRAVNVSEPGTTDGGWLQIGLGGPHPWKHVGNEGYPADWYVTHNGRLWFNPSANTFWEPSIAIWIDEGPL